MVYVATPMTSAVREAVATAWGLPCPGDEPRLPGGEESASYRVEGHVVRIGPRWRSDAELEWSYAIAARVAREVPEVTAPVASSGGTYVVRVEDRPVSVWPFAAGSWADHNNPDHGTQAADLLARLHATFAGMTDVSPRPANAGFDGLNQAPPEVDDPGLDRWLVEFMERRPVRQPLHGDVYQANLLVRQNRIVALVDWDDVELGPPEQELAWAAGEWGNVRDSQDLRAALSFVDVYIAAGGPADRIEAAELAQLVRGRIKMEVSYSYGTGQWKATDDPEEREYEANQIKTFRALHPSAQPC